MRTKLDTQENQQRSTKNLVNHRKLALIQNCILTYMFFFLRNSGSQSNRTCVFFLDGTHVQSLKFTILIFYCPRMYVFEFFDRAFRNCQIHWTYCPYQLPRTAHKMASQQMQAYKNYVVFNFVGIVISESI